MRTFLRSLFTKRHQISTIGPMTNKRLACALLTCLTQALACGSSTGGGAGGSSVGGSSAGATNLAGSGAGGSSAGATNVAGGGNGGSSAGATNVAGGGGGVAGGSSGELPSGKVSTCSGAGCPYGTCNDSSTTTCLSVYPGEIGPAAPLCKGDGQYCLGIGLPADYHSWSVHCTGTTPTAMSCTGSCAYGYTDKTADCPGN